MNTLSSLNFKLKSNLLLAAVCIVSAFDQRKDHQPKH